MLRRVDNNMSNETVKVAEVNRIRSVLHVVVGTEGVYEPTEQEVSAIANAFHASLEAFGASAVVVTRTGIIAHVVGDNVLAVTAGTDNWEPTNEDLTHLSELFHAAAIDGDKTFTSVMVGLSPKLLG